MMEAAAPAAGRAERSRLLVCAAAALALLLGLTLAPPPADAGPIDWLIDRAEEAGQAFVNGLEAIGDTAASVGQAAADTAHNWRSGLADLGSDIASAADGVLTAAVDGAVNFATTVASATATTWNAFSDKALDLAALGLETIESVVSTLGDLVTLSPLEAVQRIIIAIGEFVISMLGSASAWLLTAVIQFAFWMSAPDLKADFIYEWASRTFAIAVPLTLLLAMWQLISASLRGRPGAGARQALAGTTVAVVGTMIAIPIIASVGAIMDWLCMALADGVLTDTESIGQIVADMWSVATLKTVATGFTTASAMASIIVLSLVFLIFTICVLIGGVGLMIILLLRTLMLYVAEVMLPIAMSGLAARTSRSWPRQVLGWMLALIVSKLGVVIVLGLGVSILKNRTGDLEAEGVAMLFNYLGDLGVGAAMVLVAVMAPWMCFKFFDFLGEEAVAGAQRSLQAAVSAGASKVGAVTTTIAAVVAGAATAPRPASARGGAAAAVLRRAGLMVLASAVVYVPGLIWLKAATGAAWGATLAMGLAPFVVGDLLKSAVAALLPARRARG